MSSFGHFREESVGIGRFCRLIAPTDGQLAQFRAIGRFREESSGIARFCRLEVPTDGQLAQFLLADFAQSKFQRMANWPSASAGPVGHPLELRACKIGQSHSIPFENDQ